MPRMTHLVAKHITLALMLAGHAARAQTAPEAAPDDALAEIVVTSTKRAEDVRKVPLSISVVGAQEVEEQHIRDLTDLTRAVPNVSFSGASGQGPGLNNIEIRGISSQAGQSTVGLYLDDVSLNTRSLGTAGVAEPKFFDISRVEVLRGPQGTLYGASSMGGVIKVLTNQPVLNTFSGSVYSEVSGVYSGGVGFSATGIVNVPLIDDVMALRVGVQESFVPGYIDQVSPADGHVVKHDVNTEHDSVARAVLLIKPDDRLTITPSLFVQRATTGDNDNSYLGLDKNTTAEAIHQPARDELVIPSLTVAYDAGFADVTSITSYFYRNFPRAQDSTYLDVTYGVVPGIADPALAAKVAAFGSPALYKNSVRQISQEARIVSKPYEPDGFPVTWLAGVYYSEEKTGLNISNPIPGITRAFADAGQSVDDPNALAGSFPGAFANDNSYFANRHYVTTQYAVFGDLTYNLGPSLRATAGLRYLIARDTVDLTTGDFYFNGGATQTNSGSRSFALTPKFDVDWDVTEDQTAYVNIAKGFRLGGPNRPIPPTAFGVAAGLATLGLNGPPPASYGPDKLWNYEIGLKSRFLDNRVSLTAALFYIDWSDIQQDFLVGNSGFDFQANAGSAESYGGEAELRARITQDLTVDASGSYTHATFTTSNSALGISAGDLIESVPRWNALVGAEYRHPISDDAAIFALGTVRFVGNSRGVLTPSDPDYKRPGYNLVDASIGYDYKTWQFALFAKNLTNSDKIIQRTNAVGFDGATRLRPATIGLSATTSF